ncbi:spartin-like isoform X3 [Anguilla rostrata]|uniref:spartin-like isoform X3 n=1 Tax=Anguilla rostrata TaxID=7938 RepID=UPI0030D1D628
MEKAKQEAFDKARLQVIKDGYEKAFECINTGLTEDEVGHKQQALQLYREGRQHLLRAITVPAQGEECVGEAWDSARQMQQKMQETLNNITTRLAAMETSAEPETTTANATPGAGAAGAAHQSLYPKLPPSEKPERPAPPNVLLPNGQPVGAGGRVFPGNQAPLPIPGDFPPAYSAQAAEGHVSISYGTDSGEMSLVGDEFYAQRSGSSSSLQDLGEDGEVLLLLPQGVQIFFVTPDGQVSAPSYPGYLRVVKFTSESPASAPNRPPAFLQVCDWLYPLMFTDSPVLLCNTGVFMFPDLMAPTQGSYVGVVLSSELPASDRELFKDVLSQLTDLRVQAPDGTGDSIDLSQKVPLVPPQEESLVEDEKLLPEWSEKVAQGILSGASWLSWGLAKGAEYTGKAIHMGASKLREHITPEDTPTIVSPTVTKGLHVARQATGGAVKVSQLLVEGVCTVAGRVGKQLAPRVKKHGGKLIPESLKKDKDGRSNVDGAMVVAASGMQGITGARRAILQQQRGSACCPLAVIRDHVDEPGGGGQEHRQEHGHGDGHHCEAQVRHGGRPSHRQRRELRHQRRRDRLQHRQPGHEGCGEEDGQGDGPGHPGGLQDPGPAQGREARKEARKKAQIARRVRT